MAKDFAEGFYGRAAWRKLATEYRKKVCFCERCTKRGILGIPGEIVHHKIELDPINIHRPEIALNFENLELLCRECHAKRHDKPKGRWTEINKRRKAKKEAANRYTIDENGVVSGR